MIRLNSRPSLPEFAKALEWPVVAVRSLLLVLLAGAGSCGLALPTLGDGAPQEASAGSDLAPPPFDGAVAADLAPSRLDLADAFGAAGLDLGRASRRIT